MVVQCEKDSTQQAARQALEMEEGSHSSTHWGIQAASGSQRGKEVEFPLESQEGNSLADILRFIQRDSFFTFDIQN